jgi:lipopolysaccharide biosynthesis glycosyltransferase
MREEHISELLLECKFRNYHADRFMDQDTFNAVLGEKVKYLSFYYNLQYHVWVYDKKALAEHYGMKVIKYEWIKEAFIIHYTWRKPWDYYGYFAADIWLNHYLLSPFKDVTLHRILLNEVNEYDKYETARIDIKNFGTEDNSVTIEQCSDEAIQVESPVWLKDSQGTGLVIHSVEGKMELETRSIGAGNVRIQVRGKSCLDNDGKRYPVWIYVTCLRVDGKELFTSPHFVCYNKPFVHNLNVKDGQIVKIYIEWRSAVDILAKHFEKGEAETAKKLVMVQKKIAQLERSKANIEKELKNVKNGWSFRIGRVITWLPRKLR